MYLLQDVNEADSVVAQGLVAVSFTNIRKYSAMLVAHPIRGPITPFFGIGVGILHTSGHTPDDGFSKGIGSAGFGSFIGGINFQVSRLSAFGQYQITTSPGVQVVTQKFTDGSRLVATGNLYNGPTHTFTAGLRFSLGNARERATSGGY
jgi:hypothetical protein